MKNFLRKAWLLYYDGFREMRLGRTLWLVILIKLFVIFAVLKLFFFPRYLGGMSDEEKANTVSKELINR
ncbi:hypothetical protein BN938_1670 [Mucinivorans hirudinis]|uniref:DUF4492 domain-containing protein n=1 Tax=Mucinivorans hirudinis TaxID=1433126 RepID=A0A060R8G2_9BACT|nr:hypothetical protein BN938_1670 [Mucinivorans hirudinis]